MKLHEHQDDFKDLILATSQALGIREIYIEKDYWVTYALKNLANSDYVDLVIFKGGTSLSKALNVIERFSEDIDLALVPNEDLSNNQIKKLITNIQKTVAGDLPEIEIVGLTSKGSKFRKTVHAYERVTNDDNYGQASDKILIEVNSFANPSPYNRQVISSYIGEFLKNKGLNEDIEKFGLEEFEINVLDIRRTFVEKVLGLIRASYFKSPLDELRKKIRHIYDLERIMKKEGLSEFLSSNSFFDMIEKVKKDDADNHEFKGDWLLNPLSTSLIFSKTDEVWGELEQTYQNDFAELVYGDLPTTESIKTNLKAISKRLVDYDKSKKE